MDTQLLPYRLKSARRKRRLLVEDRDKQLFCMEREHDRLETLQKELPYVQLDEPYQRGWKRLFVLKADVQKSDKAEFYQQILDKITEVQYHFDESFKSYKRRDRKYTFEKLPKLRAFSDHEWVSKRIVLNDEQRACFKKVTIWNDNYYRYYDYYEFIEPELFEIAILPRMVYEVKLVDYALKQEADFIYHHLYYGKNAYRLQKLKGGYYKYWRSWYYIEKNKYINPLKNKPKWQWVEE